MKLEKVREEVYYFSQKASEANQKLSIAGIALIWLFRVSTTNGIQFSCLLFLAMTSFIISLVMEIIHYSILAPIWSKHYKTEYDKISSLIGQNNEIEQTEVDQPSWGNTLGWILFYGKLAFSAIGYSLFFVHMYKYIVIM